MATEALEQELSTTTPRRARRDWVDRVIDLPDRLPGPALLSFAVLYAGLVTAAHLPVWFSESGQPGRYEPYLALPSLFVVYFAALAYTLCRVAGSAFAEFRPALGGGDDDQDDLAAHFAHVPDRLAVGAAVLALVVLGAAFLLEPPAAYPEPISPFGTAMSWLLWWLAVVAGSVVIGYIVRLLRQVSHLHRIARNVDIFDPGPINAFSKLTATAAIGILVVALFFVIPEEDAYVPLAIGTGLIVLAVLSFTLPLRTMHQRLLAEKNRLLSQSHARLKETLNWIHRTVDSRDLADADQLQKTLSSLLAERDVLARLSTWPWSTGTLRGFATAAVLPVVLWLVIRGLEQFL